ncbi:hypothetical protein MG293_010313 [Ovis ammon polii]|uniref:Uncharacterized protein n=1 Tax=Ovis ammon polii TaxID=230172 RepID=A0AAD4U5N2_OVIAM|nr:hypothetical protein MG293_010313 [Ovis ammon polii]
MGPGPVPGCGRASPGGPALLGLWVAQAVRFLSEDLLCDKQGAATVPGIRCLLGTTSRILILRQLVASKARETAVSFSEESAQPRRGVPYGRELLPPGGEGQRLGRSFRFCVLLDLDSRPKGHLVHFTVDLRSPNAGPGTAMDAPPHGFCCPELIPSRARDASVSVGTAVDLQGGPGPVQAFQLWLAVMTFLSPSAVQPLGSRYPLCVALFHVALQVSDVQLWSRALDARPLWIAWILAIGEAEVFRHLSFDVRYRLLCAAAVMPVCRESDVPRRIECVLDQDACSIGFEPEILSQCPQQQSRCSQANWGPRKPDTEDVKALLPFSWLCLQTPPPSDAVDCTSLQPGAISSQL